jgi:hypothetical protein
MGCGCSKGGNRNTRRSSGPVGGERNSTTVPNNQISQQSIAPKNENKNTNSQDRRNIEKIRKEAIRRALGK